MTILFLDDDPTRHRKFKLNSIGFLVDHVSTKKEAIAALDAKRYDAAFLDHDLESINETGYDVVEHIVKMPADKRPRMVVVHSFNPMGAFRMMQALIAAGIAARRYPFSPELGPRAAL